MYAITDIRDNLDEPAGYPPLVWIYDGWPDGQALDPARDTAPWQEDAFAPDQDAEHERAERAWREHVAQEAQ